MKRRSDLFHKAMNGTSPEIKYTVNGNDYVGGYWLADGIYPSYQFFVKSIPGAQNAKTKHFNKNQELKRKDIERCFGILQRRFHIITKLSELWDRLAMKTVMQACAILYNMINDYEKVIISISSVNSS